MTNQPRQVCIACGLRFRSEMPRASIDAEYRLGVCEVCGKNAICTDPKEFGGLKEDWKNARSR